MYIQKKAALIKGGKSVDNYIPCWLIKPHFQLLSQHWEERLTSCAPSSRPGRRREQSTALQVELSDSLHLLSPAMYS